MIQAVIFDFDLTLFDSTLLKTYMNKRQWSMVYKNIPNCLLYDGVIDTLKQLKQRSIKLAIVSNAPSTYVNKVLEYYKIKDYFDFIVCYHDVKQPKPQPEGIYKVLNLFQISSNEAIFIGDNDIDNTTAKNANMLFYGVEWGSFAEKVNFINYYTFNYSKKK